MIEDWKQFVDEVARRGIDGVQQSYAAPEYAEKLRGSIAGFLACRDCDEQSLPYGLKSILDAAQTARRDADAHGRKDYW